MKQWLKKREEKRGAISMVQNELKFTDQKNYNNYLRMDEKTFNFLLTKIKDKITKKDTNMRTAISAEER